MNPSSRDFDARRRWPRLEPILRRAADVVLLETERDDARTLARVQSALASPLDRVVAIGGDGTLHLVLNAVFATRANALPELAVIPFGTANDVARSLGLPLDDLERLAAIAAGDRLATLDVGRVRASRGSRTVERIWVDAVSVGMDADVLVARGNYRELKGLLAYAAALADRSLQQRSLDVRLDVDGTAFEAHVFNVVVNNVPVYAGALELPGARRDDGLLDVYLFDRNEYGSKFLSFLTKKADVLDLGVHELLEEITENQRTLHGRRVRLRLATPRALQVDGEALGTFDDVLCEVAAQVRIAVP
jgi:diacylglycerol kinase (ATP)